MTQRWCWPGWGALLTAALLGSGCAAVSDVDDYNVPPGYILGGQTGSLVPDCGLAPLSAAGHGVPSGEALAILYAGNCPVPIAQQLTLAGAGSVPLRLVPLEGENVYLVQADRALSQGDYQLDFGAGTPSDVRLNDGEVVLDEIGPLSLLPEGAECGDQLQFELTLDENTVALAPLSRFELRLDGGAAQIWVDYGALPIESSAEGSLGRLELPRCGAQGCLQSGRHQLELSMVVAGASRQPELLPLNFEVQCPAPDEAAEPADSGSSCAVSASGAHTPRTSPTLLGLFSALMCWASRRAGRRCRHHFSRNSPKG